MEEHIYQIPRITIDHENTQRSTLLGGSFANTNLTSSFQQAGLADLTASLQLAAHIAQPIFHVRPDLLQFKTAFLLTEQFLTALPQGQPREHMTLPVAPNAAPSDEDIFVSVDGSTRFFLPRYRVATEQVIVANGQSQSHFQIILKSTTNGGSVSITLEPYPAPSLAGTHYIQPFGHSLSCALSYTIPGSGAQEELHAGEISSTAQHITATFQVESAAKLTQLASALSETDFLPRLLVGRHVQLALPTATVPEPALLSSGTATLRGTWLFDCDTGSEGTTGDIWWEQQTSTARQMTAQQGAQLALIGAADFDAISFAQLQALSYSAAPIDGSVKQIQRHFPDIIEQLPWKHGNLDGIKIRVRPFASQLTALAHDSDTPLELPSGQIRNGVVFAVQTRSGNLAKVQIIEYGYNLHIRWATYRKLGWAPGTQLYQAQDRVLEHQPDPQPFLFPRDLHPYIYRAIAGGETRYGIIQRSVAWQGRQYSYYQDEAQPQVFRYLPDRFVIARHSISRAGQILSVPWLTLSYVGDADHLETLEARLDYHALPVIELQRLQDAALTLASILPAQAAPIRFEPLLPAAQSTRLFLKRPGSPFEQRSNASIDIRSGMSDMLALPIAEFPALYAALLSQESAFIEGYVEVAVGTVSEQIPLDARLSETVGPLLSLSTMADGSLSLRNISESPIQIQALPALHNETFTALTPLNASLPISLASGQDLLCQALDPGQLTLDQSLIRPLPDALAVLRAISASIGAAFTRTITVRSSANTFAQPATNPEQQITDLIINFATGGSITLNAACLSGDVRVSFPITDFVLSQIQSNTQTQMGSYSYKLTTIRKAAPLTEETRSSTDTTLFVG